MNRDDSAGDLGLVALSRRPDSTALAGATGCFAVAVFAGFWAYTWIFELASVGKSQVSLGHGLLAVACSPVALVVAFFFGRTATSTLRFRERGVDVAFFGRPWRWIAYDECDRVDVELVRHKHHGIQAGTTIKVHFTCPGKRSIRWRCRYEDVPQVFDFDRDFVGPQDGDDLGMVLAGLKKHVRSRCAMNE